LVASQALALFAAHYFLPLHKVKGNIISDGLLAIAYAMAICNEKELENFSSTLLY